MVRGSNPGAGEILSAVRTSPEANSDSRTMGIEFLQGVKRLERGAYRPPASSAQLLKGLELHLRHPLCAYVGITAVTLPIILSKLKYLVVCSYNTFSKKISLKFFTYVKVRIFFTSQVSASCLYDAMSACTIPFN
jgi:hypothetical protein